MKTMACGGASVLRCFAIVLMAAALLIVVNDAKDSNFLSDEPPCDEFYMVKEGETYYSIAEKCDDQSILFSNPDVHDSEDIVPGVILRINPKR